MAAQVLAVMSPPNAPPGGGGLDDEDVAVKTGSSPVLAGVFLAVNATGGDCRPHAGRPYGEREEACALGTRKTSRPRVVAGR